MTRQRRRAAIVTLLGAEYEERQWRMLLEYTAEHCLEVVALVRRDPGAAVALAAAGHVDVVVAPMPDRGGVLEAAQVPVEYIRPPRGRRHPQSGVPLILSMLSRGGTPETVAQLLDVPLAEVERIQREHADRTTGQPAEHPWRVPTQRAVRQSYVPLVDR